MREVGRSGASTLQTEGIRMRMKALAGLVGAFLVAGCAGMSDTEQRVLTGGAAGATGGAIIGAIAGNAGMGAAIGAASGLAGGYLWDQHKKAEESAYRQGYQSGRSSQ